LLLNVGLIVSQRAREYLGDEILREIFNDGRLSYLAEYGDYIANDLRENSVQTLVVVYERENKDIKEFLRNVDDLTGIHPLCVEEIYTEWFQTKDQAKALILAYITKASLSILSLRIQPVRAKNISRRSLLRGKLYYYKPYPILYQDINFEREINYLTSLCPLIIKTPEGPQVSDVEKCSACGFCSGMSFLGYLEVPNFTTNQLVAFINSLSVYAPTDKVSVILISCKKLEKIPKIKEVYVYPLIAPCVASIHDSFLTSMVAVGFYPVLYSPDYKCELKDMAKLRAESIIKKFPGSDIYFPYVEDERELIEFYEKIKGKTLERGLVPEDVILSRSRRRSLLLWSIEQMKNRTPLDENDEIQGIYKVIVDPSKCVLCGVCVRSCQMLVFDMKSNGEVTNLYYDLSYCIGSQRCIRNCPENAIKLVGNIRIKELGKKIIASNKIIKCRICGKPMDSSKIKSRVDEMLISMGLSEVVNYTDVCNECKQKILTQKWIEKVLKK
jgi:ferredoxin